MKPLQCQICLPGILEFYQTSRNIVEQNHNLVAVASGHQQGMKSFGQGRVVILRDGVSSVAPITANMSTDKNSISKQTMWQYY